MPAAFDIPGNVNPNPETPAMAEHPLQPRSDMLLSSTFRVDSDGPGR